jgi:hypothetical protein
VFNAVKDIIIRRSLGEAGLIGWEVSVLLS